MPFVPTRKASGACASVSGRSSPAVSIRSPTSSARAVRRVGVGFAPSFMFALGGAYSTGSTPSAVTRVKTPV